MHGWHGGLRLVSLLVACTSGAWPVLSEADRAAAERRLAASASEGTRDELGFGTLHFAYADRFFLGPPLF